MADGGDERPSDRSPPSGAQSVERAVAILRLLSEGGVDGVRLADVVGRLQFQKPTVRRLLLVLMREGLVAQSPDTRRYSLGFEMFALGAVAGEQFGIKALCGPSILRLAEESGDTVYLSVRTGRDAVCLARRSGTYPIKTLTLSVGDRRPLGVGAGSLALLAALPDAEAEAVIGTAGPRLSSYAPNLDEDMLRRHVMETREQGYSFNDGYIVAGMKAVGVAIRNARGGPEAALSIAAVDSRMGSDRIDQLVSLLKAERAVIEQHYRGRSRR